ncbi:hypothetical protein POPTR_014G077150v4 [Populus trichocarpa]|uniref:Uncharacterized protein n=1 Tax=Populus trichocarpa TaxID=3694 RepID=A0ACC0RXR1_POPTR|nr:hypothetical protein POPTR_014G077150v4 [Populus trichocarpa]
MSHRWTELSFLRTFSNSDCLLSTLAHETQTTDGNSFDHGNMVQTNENQSCPNNLVRMRYHIKVLKWWLAMCQRNFLHCLLLLFNSMDYTFRTPFFPRTHKIIAEQAKYSVTNSSVYATSTSPLEYQ